MSTLSIINITSSEPSDQFKLAGLNNAGLLVPTISDASRA